MVNKCLSREDNEKLLAIPDEDEIDKVVRNFQNEKSSGIDGVTNEMTIAMLPMTYKILSELLANRLKHLIPLLVDSQQTGFVHGRSITDNLLAFCMGEDWVKLSKQQIALLKLDFAKAFDKVDHSFIWDTLHNMGFENRFIILLMGLV